MDKRSVQYNRCHIYGLVLAGGLSKWWLIDIKHHRILSGNDGGGQCGHSFADLLTEYGH